MSDEPKHPFDDVPLEVVLAASNAMLARDREEVRALGQRIGFGCMMDLAEQCWRELIAARGEPPGGEHTHGPCAVFLVPCGCLNEGGPVNCDWCCGAGRVTAKVREAMRAEKERGDG